MTERDGRVLLHCHAGCSQGAVIEALRSMGLWPERESRPWTLTQRRKWMLDKADERQARWWAFAAVKIYEEILEELGPCDPDRADVTRLLLRIKRNPVEEYRESRRDNPERTSATVQAGRKYDERTQILAARALMAKESSK